MLYQNCREIPIHNFNEISITGDMSFLIKEKGKHTEDELQDKWIDLIDEYNGYFNKENESLEKNKQIELLRFEYLKLIAIKNLILSNENGDEVKKILKKLNIKEDKLDRFISSCLSNLNKLSLENNIKSDNGYSFEESLIVLNENGFNVDRFKNTVSEYAFFINRLNKKINEQRKLQHRGVHR